MLVYNIIDIINQEILNYPIMLGMLVIITLMIYLCYKVNKDIILINKRSRQTLKKIVKNTLVIKKIK